MQGPGPAQKSFKDFGMSARNCSTESSWLPVESVCRSGTSSVGWINSRQAAPTAENPNPESPLIRPERKRINSIMIMWCVLNPATRLGLSGVTYTAARINTQIATTTNHSVLVEVFLGATRAFTASAIAMPPYGLNFSSKPFSLTGTSVRRIVQRIEEIAAANISPKDMGKDL